jgi:hypothetical protein|tara:strand:- start:4790 stop:6091 length:1302 start_codon:yes stop_codon:yes gene_type:complete
MTLITKAKIRQESLEVLGGYVEAITSSGDVTSIICNTLINRFADDNALVDATIFLPSGVAADQRRTITAWDDSAGDMTVATMSEQQTAAELVEIYPAGGVKPDEINAAIDRMLLSAPRVVESAIPTLAETYRYPLDGLPWIEDTEDIIEVYLRDSPNLVSNEDFEYWVDETSNIPLEWALAGTAATVTRTTGLRGSFAPSLAATGGGANTATLTYTMPMNLVVQLRGKAIVASIRGVTSTASGATISINDGIASATASSDHTGGGAEETLSLTHTMDANASQGLVILTMDQSGSFVPDRAIVMEAAAVANIPAWLTDFGSQRQRLRRIGWQPATNAPAPTIQIRRALGRGEQLVIMSTLNHMALSADTDTTDIPLRAAIAGTVTELTKVHHPHIDRDRADRLLGLWRPTWVKWQNRMTQTPNLRQEQTVVRGA